MTETQNPGGRPEIGPKAETRLSNEDHTAVAAYADHNGLSKAAALRGLIRIGLGKPIIDTGYLPEAWARGWDLYRAFAIALSEQTSQIDVGLPYVYDTVRGNPVMATAVGKAMRDAILNSPAVSKADMRGDDWWEQNIEERSARVRELLPEVIELNGAAQVVDGIAVLTKVDLDAFAARVRDLLAGAPYEPIRI